MKRYLDHLQRKIAMWTVLGGALSAGLTLLLTYCGLKHQVDTARQEASQAGVQLDDEKKKTLQEAASLRREALQLLFEPQKRGDGLTITKDRIKAAKANHMLDLAMRLDADSSENRHLEAAIYLARGENKEAIKAANEIVAKQPKNYDAWAMLATAQSDEHDYAAAVETGKKIEKLFPDRPVHKALGLVAAQAGNYEMAAQYLPKAIKEEPRNDACIAMYALSLAHLNRHEEARRQLAQLRFLDVTDPVVFIASGTAYGVLGLRKESLAEFRKVKNEPPTPGFQRIYGRLLFEVAEYDEAAVRLERALADWPEDTQTMSLLIRAYYHLGRSEDTNAIRTKYFNAKFLSQFTSDRRSPRDDPDE